MNNILVYDIETLKRMFLVVVYISEEKQYKKWEVSKWRNELDGFIRFTEQYSEYYWVGFNNLSFDSQVVERILRNYENWHTLSGEEIAEMICQYAQDRINDSNYDIFPPYREENLTLKQIDVFKINHFDNKNRMVSLKRLEFEMDMEDIEEMPILFDKDDLTREEAVATIKYCYNDVWATYQFYLITIGETEHSLYKGNNQIELRQDIEEEFGIKCLNYSDSKIGDEMIKKFYCQEKGIALQELPKKGFFRKEIPVKYCIAKYIGFKTLQLKSFLQRMKTISLKMKDDFKEEINFYENKYSFMKGGLHTDQLPAIYTADENNIIVDYDVNSMYPATIINNEKYPYHLGKEFLRGYKQMFDKRLELKPLAKSDKKIKGIVGALKLSVNSVYGKSSDMQSWLYDRQLTMFTTITGELSLLMLIEAYELNGIHVISANTDGVTIYINKSLISKVEEINSWWCNITKYELERTDYQKIVFSTVNDYVAIKTDGEIKYKGDFLIDFELYKNKSARIIPLALSKYFVNNVPIEETITKHTNIYDFAIRQKSSKDFHYEGVDEKGNRNIYNKLIRYYVAKEGEKLFKIKNPECTTNAAPVSQVEAGTWKMFVCNHLKSTHPLTNIDYSYYIEKAQKIIDKINYGGRKQKIVPKEQLSLF